MNHPIVINEDVFEYIKTTKMPLKDSDHHQINKYMIYIDTWKYKDESKNYWNYSRVWLYDNYLNKPLFYFDRNYHAPPILYIK